MYSYSEKFGYLLCYQEKELWWKDYRKMSVKRTRHTICLTATSYIGKKSERYLVFHTVRKIFPVSHRPVSDGLNIPCVFVVICIWCVVSVSLGVEGSLKSLRRSVICFLANPLSLAKWVVRERNNFASLKSPPSMVPPTLAVKTELILFWTTQIMNSPA